MTPSGRGIGWLVKVYDLNEIRECPRINQHCEMPKRFITALNGKFNTIMLLWSPFLSLSLLNSVGVNADLFFSRLHSSLAKRSIRVDSPMEFSLYPSHIDPTWTTFVRALWFQGARIALSGVLFAFAETVLNAVLSVSTIALTISYGWRNYVFAPGLTRQASIGSTIPSGKARRSRLPR